LPETNEPLLDAADIQGHVIPGFRRDVQLFAALTCPTKDAACRAFAILQPLVTPLATVMRHRNRRKAALQAAAVPPRRADLWLSVALGARLADLLELADVRDLDLAFAAGMVPSRTGDPTATTLANGKRNPAAPPNWVVGGPAHPIDLLVIFASDGDIEREARPVLTSLGEAGLRVDYQEHGSLLPGDVEHFGFHDGISQPGVRGDVVVDGRRQPITTRYGVPPDADVEFGKPGQPIAGAEQFLVDPFDAGNRLRNGSLLVFRRLRQDVAAFHADTDAMAAALSRTLGETIGGAELRARIVGRWPNGQPLMRPTTGSPAAAEGAMALNHFLFGRDVPALTLATGEQVPAASADPVPLRGLQCPVWAHIRKVNPRDLATDRGGAPETLGFQMLRRGISFGPLFDHARPAAAVNRRERGLLFVSYQRSISQQFETLNSDWMNNLNAPTPFSIGHDLLVGQQRSADGRHAAREADLFRDTTGPATRLSTPRQWVVPTGGGYLFAPSISLMKALANFR
jgi:Dyp-type peroxidase family